MDGACCTYGGRGTYGVFVGKPERNGSLGRPRREWKHIIKLNHQEIELWGVKLTNLARKRATWWDIVSALINIQVP